MFWNAPAERSGDGALDRLPKSVSKLIQSGAAPDNSGLPLHSKSSRPLHGLRFVIAPDPTDESVGYFQSSVAPTFGKKISCIIDLSINECLSSMRLYCYSP